MWTLISWAGSRSPRQHSQTRAVLARPMRIETGLRLADVHIALLRADEGEEFQIFMQIGRKVSLPCCLPPFRRPRNLEIDLLWWWPRTQPSHVGEDAEYEHDCAVSEPLPLGPRPELFGRNARCWGWCLRSIHGLAECDYVHRESVGSAVRVRGLFGPLIVLQQHQPAPTCGDRIVIAAHYVPDGGSEKCFCGHSLFLPSEACAMPVYLDILRVSCCRSGRQSDRQPAGSVGASPS
jgi:hypothetical protein